MDEITKFRGFAGEVLRSYVKPGIFVTALPIFLYWGVVALLFMVLGATIHPVISLIIIVIAAAYLLGRFALPACKGEFMKGSLPNT